MEDSSRENDLIDDGEDLRQEMTLGQYRSEIKKEALARREHNHGELVPKKGRMGSVSSGTETFLSIFFFYFPFFHFPFFSLSIWFLFLFLFRYLFIKSLSIIWWNCRGVAVVNTFNHIQDLVRIHNPSILCLVETRANEDRVFHFCYKFRAKNWIAIPAEGYLRGIIILWKSSIGKIIPLAISRASVHLVISAAFPTI